MVKQSDRRTAALEAPVVSPEMPTRVLGYRQVPSSCWKASISCGDDNTLATLHKHGPGDILRANGKVIADVGEHPCVETDTRRNLRNVFSAEAHEQRGHPGLQLLPDEVSTPVISQLVFE